MERIWTEEVMPDQWNIGVICLIHKKGDPLICKNYRSISLLNTAYKILSNIIFVRLLPYAEDIIKDYQCGFKRGRSTTDQIFTLRLILEKTLEYGIGTHHLFVDFQAAYDSINREMLYKAMREMNIPSKLVRMVRVAISNSKCQIKIQSHLSDPLRTRNGLKQGDALACLLFNLGLEKVIRDSQIQIGGHIFNKGVQLLAYADDIDIISRSESGIIEAFKSLERSAQAMGLVMYE